MITADLLTTVQNLCGMQFNTQDPWNHTPAFVVGLLNQSLREELRKAPWLELKSESRSPAATLTLVYGQRQYDLTADFNLPELEKILDLRVKSPFATVSGRVKDSLGTGLVGYTVYYGNYSTISGALGAYSIELPIGDAVLTATKYVGISGQTNTLTLANGDVVTNKDIVVATTTGATYFNISPLATLWQPLLEDTADGQLSPLRDWTTTDKVGQPTRYFRVGNSIVLDPAPDANWAGTSRLRMRYTGPVTITYGSTVDLPIPPELSDLTCRKVAEMALRAQDRLTPEMTTRLRQLIGEFPYYESSAIDNYLNRIDRLEITMQPWIHPLDWARRY